jgi:hypothetical protein
LSRKNKAECRGFVSGGGGEELIPEPRQNGNEQPPNPPAEVKKCEEVKMVAVVKGYTA